MTADSHFGDGHREWPSVSDTALLAMESGRIPFGSSETMSENEFALLLAAIAFTAVAAMTLFFSSHRKLFIRTFVPVDELREAARGLRGPSFRSGMRVMAALQFAVSGCIWFAFLIIRLY